MTAEMVLEFTKALAWPVTTALLLLFFRREIRTVVEALQEGLRVEKLKITIFGIAIETTLTDLVNVLEKPLGRELSPERERLLKRIFDTPDRRIPSEPEIKDQHHQQAVVRPLRNAGLIMTIPENKSLGSSTQLGVTPLAEFLLDNRAKKDSPEAPR